MATGLNNLGQLAFFQGDYGTAGAYSQRASAMLETTLGQTHTTVALGLSNLATFHWVKDDMDEEIALLTRVNNIEETDFTETLLGASELRQQYYLDSLISPSVNISAHLQAAPNNPQAANLAVTTLLRRKGRALDAAAGTAQQLREQLTPENQALLDELNAIRTNLSDLRFRQEHNLLNKGYQQTIRETETKANAIEAALAASSEAFRIESEPISVETIQPLIPQDAVLVEIVQYSPYNPERPADP